MYFWNLACSVHAVVRGWLEPHLCACGVRAGMRWFGDFRIAALGFGFRDEGDVM